MFNLKPVATTTERLSSLLWGPVWIEALFGPSTITKYPFPFFVVAVCWLGGGATTQHSSRDRSGHATHKGKSTTRNEKSIKHTPRGPPMNFESWLQKLPKFPWDMHISGCQLRKLFSRAEGGFKFLPLKSRQHFLFAKVTYFDYTYIYGQKRNRGKKKRKKTHSSSIKSNEACLFFPFSLVPRSRACPGLNRVSPADSAQGVSVRVSVCGLFRISPVWVRRLLLSCLCH